MANQIVVDSRQRQRLRFEVSDFSGGFFPQMTDYDMNVRYVQDIQNMELIQGMWQKRKGFHLAGKFNRIQSTSGTAKGLFVFNQQDTPHILGVFDNDLYVKRQFVGDQYSRRIYSKVPETWRVRFVEYRSNCYIAHGKGDLLKYDGNKIHEIISPPGSLITSYDNRLVLGGIKGDPMALYYSEYGNGDLWPALNFIVLDGGSHEYITALVPVHGRLVIFTNRAIYSLMGTLDDFVVTKEVDGIGAVSTEAVQVFGSRFYFVAEDGSIYEYDGGSSPRNISQAITLFMEMNVSSHAVRNAVVVSHKDAVWFTFDTSYVPEERLTLVYYPQYESWTKFVGIPAAFYIKNKDILYFTGIHDKFSLYQYGTQYSDDGSSIDAYLKTSNWSFGALENIKRFKTIYIRGAIQGGADDGFDVEFYVDNKKIETIRIRSENTNNTPKWGEVVWNSFVYNAGSHALFSDDVGQVYVKLYLSQYNVISGKTFAIAFRDRNTDHGFRIESVRLEYIQKGAR